MAHQWILGLSIDESLKGLICRVEQIEKFGDLPKHPQIIYQGAKAHPSFGLRELSLAGDEKSRAVDLHKRIKALLAELKRDHPNEFDQIAAIGISTIGVVDRERTRLRSIKRKAWKIHGLETDTYHVDFREIFDELLPGRRVKIAIHNDATASCYAEYRWQEPGDHVIRLCYANISQGINIGLIEDGRMDQWGEMRFFHPELGHAYPPLEKTDRMRSIDSGCPAHIDCYEGRASRTRIIKQWGRDLDELDSKKQKLIAGYVANFCWMAAVAAAPDRLLLGGLVSYPGFINLVRESFQRLNAGPEYPNARGYIDRWFGNQLDNFLRMARLGPSVGMFGALELARDIIDRDALRNNRRQKVHDN